MKCNRFNNHLIIILFFDVFDVENKNKFHFLILQLLTHDKYMRNRIEDMTRHTHTTFNN